MTVSPLTPDSQPSIVWRDPVATCLERVTHDLRRRPLSLIALGLVRSSRVADVEEPAPVEHEPERASTRSLPIGSGNT